MKQNCNAELPSRIIHKQLVGMYHATTDISSLIMVWTWNLLSHKVNNKQLIASLYLRFFREFYVNIQRDQQVELTETCQFANLEIWRREPWDSLNCILKLEKTTGLSFKK